MDENKKFPKRNIVLYVSIVVILVSLTFKVSYGYFVATLTNLTNPTATVAQSGNLQINFGNNTQYFNVQNLTLMTAAEAATASNNYSSFTVSNTGTVSGQYKLYLSNYSITENLVNADFKYKLTVNGNVYTGTFYDLFSGKTPVEGVISSTSDDIALLSSTDSIAPNASHNCEFRVWLQDEDRNQINLTEGSFSTKIKLIAVQS